jgi:SAM-dependent methyltransferase
MSGAEGPAPPNAWEARPARLADARACYRYILGQDEADEGLLTRHAEAARTIGALRGRFLGSEEFRQSLLGGAAAAEGPAPEVDLAADEAQLAGMMTWARRLWSKLGEAAPHWSVLPEDRYRPERIEENRRAFRASGAAEAAALLADLARCGVEAGEVPRLVEHGCGVGRVTAHLAAHFPEVACVDVSGEHLSVARAELKGRGLVHLRFLRAKEGDWMPGPEGGYDLWYSRRVLQWNPPPLIRQMLWAAFAGLAPRGVAVFQVPVWRAGYRFSAASYLGGRQPAEPELHLMPQADIFRLAAEAGMWVLGAWDDSHLPIAKPGPWRSTLFVMRKAG